MPLPSRAPSRTRLSVIAIIPTCLIDRRTAAGPARPLVCDGHDYRLESVVESGSVRDDYDGLLSRRGANRAPREVFAGFRHVDAGIGDETAKPSLARVGDSQERQAAGDLIEGA